MNELVIIVTVENSAGNVNVSRTCMADVIRSAVNAFGEINSSTFKRHIVIRTTPQTAVFAMVFIRSANGQMTVRHYKGSRLNGGFD